MASAVSHPAISNEQRSSPADCGCMRDESNVAAGPVFIGSGNVDGGSSARARIDAGPNTTPVTTATQIRNKPTLPRRSQRWSFGRSERKRLPISSPDPRTTEFVR